MGNSQGSYEISPSKLSNLVPRARVPPGQHREASASFLGADQEERGLWRLNEEDSSDSEDRALGIEACAIPACRITASSSTDSAPACYARLNGSKAWCAGSPADCFLEVDLDTVHYVTGVATQGNPSGNHDYVKMYKVQYSTDGMGWEFYQENYKEVLEGNTDHCTAVKKTIDPKIKARYVRIWPTAWFQWPSLRVEVYGKPAPTEKMSENGCTTITIPAQEKRLPEGTDEEETKEREVEIIVHDIKLETDKITNGNAMRLDEEDNTSDVEPEECEKIFEIFDTSTPAHSQRNGVVHKQPNAEEGKDSEVLVVSGDDVDLKRLMDVRTKLQFEAEARTLKEEQTLAMKTRKNNKKVTLGSETPDYFFVPRRVYNDMWGDSPSGSIADGLDQEKKPLIEVQDGGAPLAKHDDDVIEEDTEHTRNVTIQTVTTVTMRHEKVNRDEPNRYHDNQRIKEHDRNHARNHVHDRQDSSIIAPLSSQVTRSEPENLFMLVNGFNEPTPFAARASCEHLHPTDPAVQAAMESSFNERVDSMDQLDMNPLTNRRFSGLDLLQSPYDAVSGDDIERLLAWEDDTLPGWTKVKKTREYEIFKGTAVDGGPPIIKTIITFKKIAYDEAVRRITDWEIRKKWDKTFDNITLIEQSYNFNVVHCATKKQGLTLAVMDDVDIDEPYHASVWSIADHPEGSSLKTGKPLRYETMISGLVIRPTGDGFPSSRVTLLCQVKGSVSQPLKGTFLVGSPEKWIEMLKRFSPLKKGNK